MLAMMIITVIFNIIINFFFSFLSPSLRLCFSFLLADVFQQGKLTVSCLLFHWLCSFGRVSPACRGLWGFTFFCGRIMGASGGTTRMMAWGGLKCHQHSWASTVQPLLLPLDLAWEQGRGWTVGAETLGRGSWPGAYPRAGLLWGLWDWWDLVSLEGIGWRPLHQGQLQLGQGPIRHLHLGVALSSKSVADLEVWARPWLAGHFLLFNPGTPHNPSNWSSDWEEPGEGVHCLMCFASHVHMLGGAGEGKCNLDCVFQYVF